MLKLIIAQANLIFKGGAERVVLKIAQHYKAKIYTAEYSKENTFEGFKDLDIEIIGKSAFAKLLPYGRAAQGLNYGLSFYNFRIKDDYDVINAHIAPSHWIRNKNERVLWYCHTPLRDVYDLYDYRLSLKKSYQRPIYAMGAGAVRLIDKDVVKRIGYIVANSNNTKSRIEKYYGRHDALVLGGGVDYEMFSNEGDDRYFFYPSRISPNKRQDYAMRAFEIFKSRVKGYKLIIAGDVSKDKLYYDYYTYIKDLASKIGDVEIIVGASDKKLNELYARSTAVLFAAMNEDYGLVPLEAMASRKPIISVNEGGPIDTIVNGKTGYLVNSIEEMAARMEQVSEDQQLASELGRNGRRRIISKYSWKYFFSRYDKILAKAKSGS
ncbi:MAG: glycosyltransferase family 4 protein [Candidatus Marsarchaeota archaeon]|jgi:glycosyltransferase involved in cell wall biosynthesis|nr:glycosyltransferase family 4 protein [Candidatus Marsarchaeota archaeon]MCL5418658.1 glycosyltransferase family 4 protein [Candidatus Marsarchaeota archaeon]